ncbi:MULTISPECIES: nucleotidyltransferase domain-containing protein [Bacillaceae]|uniref:Nucleotidyltransferase domain-containing protein n=1 Tax=Evansella alkalicola TaxID=745819 RepID=A0ABS6K1X6_9BACI|nr:MULTISPECIES: nucleotidyltransferase domain-containing protein [Bacillaceae]MBU9723492.1 nucleotidyltransferase domain-containing protein [Bacillus alkalicola]
MFGLREEDIQYIKDILAKYNEVEKAYIFGSRAIGNHKKGSDVDIAIVGSNINSSTVATLDESLNEESPLPYFFDIIHYDVLSNKKLKQHIDTEGKTLIGSEEASL